MLQDHGKAGPYFSPHISYTQHFAELVRPRGRNSGIIVSGWIRWLLVFSCKRGRHL